MDKIFLILLFSVWISSVAKADDIQEKLLLCTKETMDEKRLECFDAVALQLVPTEQTDEKEAQARELLAERLREQNVDRGHWRITSQISRIDDSKNVTLRLTSYTQDVDRFGNRENLWIVIACQENKTSVIINFAGHFMADNSGRGSVTYRVDEKSAKRRNFRESNDNSVLGLWGGATSIPFIKEIMGGKNLYVEALPFSDSTVSGEFNISGLDNAIKPLRAACHW